MAWLIDPRMWDDPWYRSLPSDAREVFKVVLFGNFRTSIPGLVKGASVVALSDALAFTVEQAEHALGRVLTPDGEGKAHVYFDPVARVIRVPNAPRYNKCTNPNQLTGWFRAWRDVPECALKAAHLETIPAGVNLANPEMLQRWNLTFGLVISSRENGVHLSSYADLDHGTGKGQQTLKGFREPSARLPHSEWEMGSGSGSGSKALASLSEASLNLQISQSQKNHSAVGENGGGGGAIGHGDGVGLGGAAGGPGGGPGGAAAGGEGGGQPGSLPAKPAPRPRRKLPPGLQ